MCKRLLKSARWAFIGALLVAIGHGVVLAQGIGSMTITVTDESGARVVDTLVLLRNGSETRTLTTGADGVVRAMDLRPGEWVVFIAREGFTPNERTVIVGEAPIEVPVSLAVASLQETIQVEATRPPAAIELTRPATGGTLLDIPVRQLPASLSIVTQQLMVERGARTSAEAIEAAVGMNATLRVGSGMNYETRGFSSVNGAAGAMTVLNDGISGGRSAATTDRRRLVDTFLLDRVEVLKGPASLIYGEGSIGGAINQVSKEPQSLFGGELLASYGSFGTYRVGVGVSSPLGRKVAARIDAVRSDTEGYVDNGGQMLEGSAGSIRWAPNDRVRVSALANYSHEDTQSYYGAPLINGVMDPRTRRLNYNFKDALNKTYNTWGRIQTDVLMGTWRFQNRFFTQTYRLDRRDIRGYTYNPRTQRVDVQTYFLSNRNALQFGDTLDAKNTFLIFGRPGQLTIRGELNRSRTKTAGLSGTRVSSIRYSVDPYNPEPIFDPGLLYEPNRYDIILSKGLYAETMVDVTSQLKLVGGLRWDNIGLDLSDISRPVPLEAKTTHSPVTGRYGAVYGLTSSTNVYLSYSRAVEPATTNDGLDGTGLRFSLSPARQWEVGSKAAFFNGRVDTTLALFDIEMRDILTTSLIDGISTPQQIGRQTSRGVELAVVGRPMAQVTISGDVAWTDAKFGEFIEVVSGRNVSRSGNVPPFASNVVANLAPLVRVGAFEVSARLRHITDRFGDNANSFKFGGYTTFDAGVAYRFLGGRYRLTLRGRNLTDELYSNGTLSAATQFMAAAPRSVEINLATRF